MVTVPVPVHTPPKTRTPLGTLHGTCGGYPTGPIHGLVTFWSKIPLFCRKSHCFGENLTILAKISPFRRKSHHFGQFLAKTSPFWSKNLTILAKNLTILAILDHHFGYPGPPFWLSWTTCLGTPPACTTCLPGWTTCLAGPPAWLDHLPAWTTCLPGWTTWLADWPRWAGLGGS